MEELQQNALEMTDETIAEENELDLAELFYRLVEKWKLTALDDGLSSTANLT